MHRINAIWLSVLVLVLCACSKQEDPFDAAGSFEAVETIIASEATGKILSFTVHEGDQLEAGQIVGYVDSTQLHLQRLQLLQNKKTILTGKPNRPVQVKATREQLSNAMSERDRVGRLVKGGVATQRQLDDANGRVATIEAQLSAQENSLSKTAASLNEQGGVVDIQLEDVMDRLKKCTITNPVKGTVLGSYVEQYEMTAIGKPLYKIADLSVLTLRVYVTGDQLAKLKLGGTVKVMADNGAEKYYEDRGTVVWISNKAEFTPKSIHTKNERANLVYAVKVKVKNDGKYKIGMYGGIKFD